MAMFEDNIFILKQTDCIILSIYWYIIHSGKMLLGDSDGDDNNNNNILTAK